MIDDRYSVDFDYKGNIIILENEYKLIYHKFESVLIMDYGTTGILPYTFSENYHLIYDHDKNYIPTFQKYMQKENVTVYNEMPYGIGDVFYKLRFPFDLYKEIKSCEPNCLINASGKSTKELDRAFTLTDKKLIITGDPTIKESERISVYLKHPKDFFELWDTYMYIHDGIYFEPRCRLLMEAYHYDKNIIYDNQYGIKDGSWYRYSELKEMGLKERYFEDDDLIMEIL